MGGLSKEVIFELTILDKWDPANSACGLKAYLHYSVSSGQVKLDGTVSSRDFRAEHGKGCMWQQRTMLFGWLFDRLSATLSLSQQETLQKQW